MENGKWTILQKRNECVRGWQWSWGRRTWRTALSWVQMMERCSAIWWPGHREQPQKAGHRSEMGVYRPCLVAPHSPQEPEWCKAPGWTWVPHHWHQLPGSRLFLPPEKGQRRQELRQWDLLVNKGTVAPNAPGICLYLSLFLSPLFLLLIYATNIKKILVPSTVFHPRDRRHNLILCILQDEMAELRLAYKRMVVILFRVITVASQAWRAGPVHCMTPWPR